jgi:hypothetical protein
VTERLLRPALFVHLFLFALVVGVFWGTWFSLSRSMSVITAATFIDVPIPAPGIRYCCVVMDPSSARHFFDRATH